MRAISADIYTNKRYSTCSNNGISSQFTEILIPHPRGNLEMTGEEPNAFKWISYRAHLFAGRGRGKTFSRRKIYKPYCFL